MSKNLEKNAKEDKENLHSGHRKRLKEKYLKGGIDLLEFHEIIELLLYFTIPRRDTNKIAHEIAEKFKDSSGKYSLANIFEADVNRLREIKGIADSTVFGLKILTDITRLYNIELSNKPTEITAQKSHEEHLIAYFTGKSVEEVVLITLNNRNERITEIPEIIYTGSVNSTKVDIRKMVKIALDYNASSVILAHNHPNGPDTPSLEDIETTRRIEMLFNEISINFIDHYVVSDKRIASIKGQQLYRYR